MATKGEGSWVLVLGVIAGAIMLFVMVVGALFSAGFKLAEGAEMSWRDIVGFNVTETQSGKTASVTFERNGRGAYGDYGSIEVVSSSPDDLVLPGPWAETDHLMDVYPERKLAIKALLNNYLSNVAWAGNPKHEQYPQTVQIRGYANPDDLALISRRLGEIYSGEIEVINESNLIDPKTLLDKAKESSKLSGVFKKPDLTLKLNVNTEENSGTLNLFARTKDDDVERLSTAWVKHQVFASSGIHQMDTVVAYVGQSEHYDSKDAAEKKARMLSQQVMKQAFYDRVTDRYPDFLKLPVNKDKADGIYDQVLQEYDAENQEIEMVFTQSYEGLAGRVYRSQVAQVNLDLVDRAYRRVHADESGLGITRSSRFQMVVMPIILGLVYAFLASINRKSGLWSVRTLSMVAGICGLMGLTLLLPL